MSCPPRILFLFCLVAVTFFASPGFAHKVNVFAYEEKGIIYCETMFSGGKPAIGATITVQQLPSNQTLLTGTTNDKGTFNFPLSSIAHQNHSLKIEVRCDDGHMNTWTLAPEDYLAETSEPSEQKQQEPAHIAQTSPGIQEVVTGLSIIFCLGIFIKFIQVRRKRHAK